MTWWMLALISTIFWGTYYLSVGKLSPYISPVSIYWLPCIPLFLGVPLYYQTLVQDWNTLLSAPTDIKVIAGVSAIASLIASLLFYKSIGMSNATHASLIQISYPFFIALLSLVIFRENHFTTTAIIGGLFIMVGAGLIIYGNNT